MRIFGTLLLIMSIGLIFKPTFSQQWEELNTGTEFVLTQMSFPPNQNNIGYACGTETLGNSPGIIIKTTDGGDNWEKIWPVDNSPEIDGLEVIWFTDSNNGFAAGWNNYFIKTTDGGETWENIIIADNIEYFQHLEFWDESNGFMHVVHEGFTGGDVYITNDGGTSWEPANDFNPMGLPVDFCYASQNRLQLIDGMGGIFESTDGGFNWLPSIPAPGSTYSITFGSNDFRLIGSFMQIFYSNDNGATNYTELAGFGPWEDLLAFPNGEAYAAGAMEHVLVTNNYGETWEDGNFVQDGRQLLNLSSTQNGTIYACGEGGLILKKAPPITPCIADFSSDVHTIVINSNNTEGQIEFTNTCSGTIDNYEWTFEGGNPPTSNEPNPVVLYDEVGTFDVKLKVTNAMYEDEVLKEDYITVDTDESIFNINSNDINVYPVPASTTITITFNNNLSGSKTLKIFDTMGHEITKIYTYNDDLLDIDISFLPAGLYMITVESVNGNFSHCFVKK